MDIEITGTNSCTIPPAKEAHSSGMTLTYNIIIGCLLVFLFSFILYLWSILLEEIEQENNAVILNDRCSCCNKASSTLPQTVIVQTPSSGSAPEGLSVHEPCNSDVLLQSISQVLESVESRQDIIVGLALAIINKVDFGTSLDEALLRIQGSNEQYEGSEFLITRTEEPFLNLNKNSDQLKRFLRRIPKEIADRKTFLETVKEIASTIKKVLDSVAGVSVLVSNPNARSLLEQRKREFIKYSERFSTTLKDYLNGGLKEPVYTSALNLINQTNLIMTTLKARCE